MTIEKGQVWGIPGPLPADGVVVASDAGAADALMRARSERRPRPVLGLVGGDLARTCGATGDEGRLHGPHAQRLPVDLGEVLVDGTLHYFVAHLVTRRRWHRGGWWTGRVRAVMNAQFLGTWDVAPRSHPNDGVVDVFDADLSVGDRFKARSRLASGTHVPHPGIAQRRTSGLQIDLDVGEAVWLDGRRIAGARSLSIRVEPDAFQVVV